MSSFTKNILEKKLRVPPPSKKKQTPPKNRRGEKLSFSKEEELTFSVSAATTQITRLRSEV